MAVIQLSEVLSFIQIYDPDIDLCCDTIWASLGATSLVMLTKKVPHG